ncbi:hypothetical protein T4D_5128 [Trichinella pseudospiralis]|uniref:Uncharacterized protein n=1 Tax=Trichinella pseudospiralis TaxID=6337 RepID=A0A0V1FPE1_TRIPS|nr:hypothetical protein T4D_5128 [Trichinella pseudospiralis]
MSTLLGGDALAKKCRSFNWAKTFCYLDGNDIGVGSGSCVNGRGERRRKENSFTGHESSSPPMTLTVAFHGNGYIIALPDQTV